jgi:septal ring factor EnvC (AmiA/AmiB activator)
MDSESSNPLQSLVQSVTRQQQTRCDLLNRLNYLSLQVTQHNEDVANLALEEQSLRKNLADINRSNSALEDKTSIVIQNCDSERQSRSSLALTLDSLNDKKSSLKDAVNDRKIAYDVEANAIRQKLASASESLTDLLDNKGNKKKVVTPPYFIHNLK